MIRRNGMTVPLPGHLHAQRDKLVQLADWGYSDIWSAETDGADAFTPLALAAAWEPRLRLGTAIVPAYTRTAPVIAQSVAAMADAAPGRFAIGIGSSSNVIVEKWNGVPFVDPYKKVRDVVRFMHDAFSGEKITKEYETFKVDGFRLSIKPEQKPTILIAALREGMLKLGPAKPMASSSTGFLRKMSPRLQRLCMVQPTVWKRKSLRAFLCAQARTPKLFVPVRGLQLPPT